MGFLGWIKGLGKADRVVDTGLGLIESGAKGIDAMFYTDEEKAIDNMKSKQAIVEHAIKMNEMANDENSMRSITRRWLACIIIGNSLLVFDYCIYLLQKGKKELVGDIIRLTDKFGWDDAILAIIIFYFGYYGVSKIVEKVKK